MATQISKLVSRMLFGEARGNLRRGAVVAVVGIICLHYVLAVSSVFEKSATFDELAHVTAGYSYWKLNDYRLNPENGNLPQRWAALPLVLFNQKATPRTDQSAWRTSNSWAVGYRLFHGAGNDFQQTLLLARSAMALVSAGLCLLVFCWSRSMFGNVGGFVSLILCALSPTVLAHGHLATSDLFVTFFFAASVWSIWSLLHKVTLGRTVAVMLTVAGLFLSKASAVLILPIAAALALMSLMRRQALPLRLPFISDAEYTTQGARRACVATVVLLIGITTYTSVWAAFGFRYAASTDGLYEFYKLPSIVAATARSGDAGRAIQWLADRKVLPEAYLFGAAFVAAHEERSCFLNGEYSKSGWRHFFPFCLLVKTPLALFGLLALALGGLRPTDNKSKQQCWDRLYQVVPLAVPLVVLWGVFLGAQLNIGHRHILPTYPFMFVLAGAVGPWVIHRSRIAAGVVVTCLLWFTTSSLAAYPHYLAYFNSLVARDKAHEHLVDSSLDWGQDLPALAAWLDDNASHDQRVYLTYFGSDLPVAYDIEAQRLPIERPLQQSLHLQGGVYCISATRLQSLYGFAPGRWNKEYENAYRALEAQLAEHYSSNSEEESSAESRAEILPQEQLIRLHQQWDMFKVRRLIAHLRHREPDGRAGHSILIYRLSDEDIDRALTGPPAELDDASLVTRYEMQAKGNAR